MYYSYFMYWPSSYPKQTLFCTNIVPNIGQIVLSLYPSIWQNLYSCTVDLSALLVLSLADGIMCTFYDNSRISVRYPHLNVILKIVFACVPIRPPFSQVLIFSFKTK